MKHILYIIFLALFTYSCCNGDCEKAEKGKSAEVCGPECQATNKQTGELSCKLSSPEMRRRKETVLASLKKQVIERKTLKNGYAYKFPGSDKMIDELTEFIKTERQCCSFFIFNLSISGDGTEIWLELTGVEGAKEFIDGELDF